MAFLKRICTVILLMLLTFYYAESTMRDGHFSFNRPPIKKLIEPLSYEMGLELPFEEDDFIIYSTSKASIIIENPTRKIYLNALGLTIEKKEFRLFRYPYMDSYNLKNCYYLNETGTLIFDFETDVPSGFYDMDIGFTGNISENKIGVYRTFCEDCKGAAKWFITTQLKPTAARRLFPCWDEPSLKARFAITISHHPDYTVLSNMPILSQWSAHDDMMVTQFDSTPPIPTYLVAFSLTDLTCYGKRRYEITSRVCCRPLVKDRIILALNTSVDVMSYLKWYMFISPQLLITSIGLSDFPYEVTGNWGLNIYRESHLIHNETLHSIVHKLDVLMYVGSMVALQWFGNLVSPTWWMDTWFFQTLALFYGARAVGETYNNKNISTLFTYRLQSLARENNVVSKMHPVTYEANNQDEIDKLIKSNHFTNCLKEYAILVMLEYAVTETIFRSATIKYLKKHQFSSGTPNDFWDMIEDEINNGEQESFYHYPSPVEIVHGWLKQRSLPVITVSQGISNDVTISQEYTTTEKDDDNINILSIPINYVTKSKPASVSDIMWLGGYGYINRTDIPISDWVIVNWQHAGYYRVRYDDLILQRLINCLDSEDYNKIHVLSRAHIIEDAHYFWSENKLNIRKFRKLLRVTYHEEQCAPWYAMQRIFTKMWPFLNMRGGTRTNGFIRHILNEVLKEIGYTEHAHDAECIKFKRLLATEWACRLSHNKCLEIAKERLIEHLKNPQSRISSLMWEKWTYCNGLVLADMFTWDSVFKEFRETKNTRILEYLVCSKNITTILNYLDLVMSNNPLILSELGVNSEDNRKIYRFIVKKHVREDKVLDYVLKKLIKKDFIDKTFVEGLSYIIGKVYSVAQTNKISLLLKSNYDPDGEVYRILDGKIQHQNSQIQKLGQLVKPIGKVEEKE